MASFRASNNQIVCTAPAAVPPSSYFTGIAGFKSVVTSADRQTVTLNFDTAEQAKSAWENMFNEGIGHVDDWVADDADWLDGNSEDSAQSEEEVAALEDVEEDDGEDEDEDEEDSDEEEGGDEDEDEEDDEDDGEDGDETDPGA